MVTQGCENRPGENPYRAQVSLEGMENRNQLPALGQQAEGQAQGCATRPHGLEGSALPIALGLGDERFHRYKVLYEQ